MRWRALAYKYDFRTDTNNRIIADVRSTLGDRLDDADDEQRKAARTVAQYLAHLRLRPAWSKWLFEAGAIPGLPLFLAWAWAKGLFRTGDQMRTVGGVRMVFRDRFKINPEIFLIPDELASAPVETRPLKGGFLLGRDVRRTLRLFISAVKLATPFPSQLALKCAVDLSKVRGALTGLVPVWVTVYWEFSCAVTFIAAALRQDGIETYNVMHGDKNFFAKAAFFEVTRCYCWDVYYVDLFQRGHVRADFRVFQNPAFRLSSNEVARERESTPIGVGLMVPALVTLSANPREAMRLMGMIADACNIVAAACEISVRPHPLYGEDFYVLRPKLNGAVRISKADSEGPRAFILNHALLIGTNSTMLLEAAHLGRKVVLLSTAVTAEAGMHPYLHRHPNVFRSSIADLMSTIVRVANIGDESLVSVTKKN